MEFTIFPLRWLLCSILLAIIGILSLIWTPFELLLEERLRMRPGLPFLDWWLNPPQDLLHMRIVLFNITNAEQYLSGHDSALSFEEVGPIVFKVLVNNSDVIFNDNSTLTYTLRQAAEHVPELSSIGMNDTLIYPNFGLLGSASYFWNANIIFKMLYNYVVRNTKAKPIVRKTVYQILYDNDDKFFRLAHATLPHMVPLANAALMPLAFKGVGDKLTVFIGTKYGHQKFFLVDKYNGMDLLPNLGPECRERATGSGISYIYSQKVPKSRVMRFINPSMCRSASLVYKDEVVFQGIRTYRFVQSQYLYNRTGSLEDDCYKGDPVLPNGVFDMGPCFFSFPITGSNPHFMHGDKQLLRNIRGMKPDVEKYTSYLLIEPISGVILKSEGHIQANVHMWRLDGFDKSLDKFSDMSIPLFHSSLVTGHVPLYVTLFIKVGLMLQYIGPILSAGFLLAAILCAWICRKKMPNLRKRTPRTKFDRKFETVEFIPKIN